MDDYTSSTYGDRIADLYDELFASRRTLSERDETVEALTALAGAGPVLELAIGTGRIALPLAARGVPVHGIDASQRMVDVLRSKPGGEDIPITMGDFADVAVDGEYTLIFVVFNTFFALFDQEHQVRCMRNVGAHLRPGGCFVIEAFVPDLARFDRGQRTSITDIGVDSVKLDVSIHDSATQRVDSQHVVISPEGVRLLPVRIRYAWPSELDLMAQLAGLRLRDRWSGWKGKPFDSSSTIHVSIYVKAAGESG
jgi:SAM-dependent methyltransferase